MVDFKWPQERPHFATVTRIVDGDTFEADVDMDYNLILRKYKIRLKDCAAAKDTTEGGKACAAYLARLLPIGTVTVVVSSRSYKFGGGKDHIGEFVARPWVGDVDIVAKLLAEGWVEAWDGSGTQPVPPYPPIPRSVPTP